MYTGILFLLRSFCGTTRCVLESEDLEEMAASVYQVQTTQKKNPSCLEDAGALAMLDLALRSDVEMALHSCMCPAGRGEEDFLDMCERGGFPAADVPKAQLHEEYQLEEYRIVRLCKLGS